MATPNKMVKASENGRSGWSGRMWLRVADFRSPLTTDRIWIENTELSNPKLKILSVLVIKLIHIWGSRHYNIGLKRFKAKAELWRHTAMTFLAGYLNCHWHFSHILWLPMTLLVPHFPTVRREWLKNLLDISPNHWHIKQVSTVHQFNNLCERSSMR